MRTGTEIWRRERDFVHLLQGGSVREKSLGVSTLQAAEPPYVLPFRLVLNEESSWLLYLTNKSMGGLVSKIKFHFYQRL